MTLFFILLFLPVHAQKCFRPTPPPSPPPPSPLSAPSFLFPPSFLSSTFQKHPHHLSNSLHPNRTHWLRTYRTFLPHNDLDALLVFNTSHTKGPLRLHHDLTLIHSPTQTPLQHFHPKSPHLFSLSDLHAAVKDGFKLIVHHMESRTKTLAHFSESLREFFCAPVHVDLHFTSPVPPRHTVKPHLFADDVWIVLLEGQLNVSLYEDMFPHPAPRHLQDSTVMKAAFETAAEITPTNYTLSEGDILYIPPGCGLYTHTTLMALYVQFHIATYTTTVDQGLISTIHAARGKNNPLHEPLSEQGPGEDSTWGDLLRTAVRIAAEFTPEIRRFLPMGEEVSEMMEDQLGESLVMMLGEEVENFVAAAKGALLEPVVDVLRGGEEGLKTVASEDLINWAIEVNVKEVRAMWRRCVEWVGEMESAVHDGFMALQMEVLQEEKVGRERRLRERDIVLEMHGVKLEAEWSACANDQCSAKSSERFTQ